MELRQLKYFLAVAESRSFLSAASNLYISRQAVSKAVAQLEAELNVELFMRVSSGAFLTPAGILFYERVRNIMLELEQLQLEMSQYGMQYRQTIRVAFSIGTLTFYEHSLQEFIRRQNRIHVDYWECMPEECDKLLREHRADLVITSRLFSGDEFQSQVLYESPYGVIMKEQGELDELDILDAADLGWMPLGCFADGQSEQMCSALGVAPTYKGVDLFRLITISADGQCATLLPKALLPQLELNVRWIPLDTQKKWRVSCAYLKATEKNTLLQSALDEFILQVFHQETV